MLFNSFEFLLFFPIVTALYFLLPHKFRWFHLLIASCIFYMAFIPIYILILFFTIIIDYIAGIMIEKARGKKKKWFLVMSIIANVGVLAFFKYYNFFAENINYVLHAEAIPLLNIILPIGLSFHTFQAMSYTIEVYRKKQKAEKNIGIYALYVMFYPQLVAGPIERPQNILPQIHEKKHFDYNNAVWGLRLILWGMIKKIVIADRLAQFTDPVFNQPHSYSALTIGIAVLFFTFQIFCDFSGYSDIAMGCARFMGFKLMTNFNKPYHSRSISEFWKRWHISLSTWFRDYLYISIGGNRVSIPHVYFNIFFVFLVSGFWHGANWTFIVWGALHGLYTIFALLTKEPRKRIKKSMGLDKVFWLNNTISVLSTFILVAFAWVFFRANTVSDGFYIAGKLISLPRELFQGTLVNNLIKEIPVSVNALALSFMLIFFLELVHILQVYYKFETGFSQKPIYLRWAIYYGAVAMLFFLGVFEERSFIYFQF
jgi:alginate O-acetyltransferase complex protein AlgI